MINIRMLGGFEARLNDVLITDFHSIKAEALLAYLAYNHPHPVRRDRMGGLLWPDQEQEKAQTNLRKSLSRLKQALEIGDSSVEYVQADRTFLQLSEEAEIVVDVALFEKQLETCAVHRGAHSLECEDCIRNLDMAIELYSGEFLQSFFVDNADLFDEWLIVTREKLHNRALNALQCLARYYEFQGNYPQALQYVRWQLSLEPWLEEAHRQAMYLLIYQGDYSAALRQYHVCMEVLQKYLGIEPNLETRQLIKRIQNLPEKRPHNLPLSQDKTFIARDKEYNYIRQHLVKPNQNLLTLMGLGGIGKTSLVLQVAWSVIKDHFGPFVDGVCYISLHEEETRFSKLVTEMADFFSIPLAQSPQPEKVLFQQLKQKECLLIIDNGEYLGAEGKQFIQELLKTALSIRILVVSRESLHLTSEWHLRLDGLSLPKISSSLEPDLTETSGAVNLFHQRCHRVMANFHWKHLDDMNRRALFDICYLTQGLPLALELAASWISKLSCQQIASEIQNGLDILVSQYGDTPDRHQSIRAVFSYSWKLLSEDEQRNLMDLAVFPSDFDKEASIQIAGVNLFTLSALIDKSLLNSVVKAGRVYYQMHNLLRQFVQEHCSEERFHDLQTQHALYYSRFLEAQRQQLRSAETSIISKDVSLELDNLQAAWHWIVQNQQFSLLDLLIDGFYEYYTIKGWWQEGLALFSTALELFQFIDIASQPHRSLTYTRLLSRLAEFHYSLGELAQAEAFLQEAQKMIQLIEDPAEMALIYEKLGRIAQQYGNLVSAQENIEFSLQIIESHYPKGTQNAHILMSLGSIARDQGRWQEAEGYFQQSLDIYQALPSKWGIAHSKRLLANIYIERHEFSKASIFAQQSLALFQNIEDLIGEALAHRELGRLASAQENYQPAETHFQKALALLKKKQNVKSEALLYKDLGSLFLQCQRYIDAQQNFLQAFESAYKTRDTFILVEALASFLEATLLSDPHVLQSSQFIALANSLHYNFNTHHAKIGATLDRIRNNLLSHSEDIFSEDNPVSIEAIYTIVVENFLHTSLNL